MAYRIYKQGVRGRRCVVVAGAGPYVHALLAALLAGGGGGGGGGCGGGDVEEGVRGASALNFISEFTRNGYRRNERSSSLRITSRRLALPSQHFWFFRNSGKAGGASYFR